VIPEKLTFLLEKLESKVITMDEFRVLLDKDMQSIKSLTSILEDSSILENNTLFFELLDSSRVSVVTSILDKYPIYKRDLGRRKFLLQNINHYYIGDLVPVLQYDFVFHNSCFLNKLVELAESRPYTCHKLFDQINQVFSTNYEYLSMECARPFIEKACLLSNFSNVSSLLHILEIPALRNLEFFNYLYCYYEKGGHHDFYDSFSLLDKNSKLEFVLDKVSSVSNLEYFTRILNHLSYLSSLDGEAFDFCLRHILVSDEDFSYIPSFINVSLSDEIYLKMLTFPSVIKRGLFDSFSTFFDLDFLEQLSTYSISDMKVMLMKFAIENKCLDYILKNQNSFVFKSSLDISSLSFDELISLKNKIDTGCYLFDGKSFTFTLLENDFPYLISDNFSLLEEKEEEHTKIKKKTILDKIFRN